MQAEFEEKTYENFFNGELDNKYKSFIYPIGQVAEGILGFDCCAYTKEDKELWKILESPPLEGLEFKKIAEKMEKNLNCRIKNIPYEMRINLLFQYKRPEYIETYKHKEWNNWRKPYFRYTIHHKQQNLLMEIDKYFGNNVLTIYASPAFYTQKDLIEAKNKGQIIIFSNFCEVSKLDGHNMNTYVKEGTHSIACSRPKFIKNLNLKDVLDIEKHIENFSDELYKKNKNFIIKFGKGILFVIQKNKYFQELTNHLNTQCQLFNQYELLNSYIILNEVKKMVGLQWLIT